MPCGISGYFWRTSGLSPSIVPGHAVVAVAERAAHRLDAAADDEVLVARQHAGGGHADGLLAGAAEAVDRQARRGERPAGAEHGEAGDVGAVVADAAGVAGDDVLDLRRVDARALHDRVEALGQQLLRVDVVQGAVLLALAAWGAHPVDDPGLALAHGWVSPSRRSLGDPSSSAPPAPTTTHPSWCRPAVASPPMAERVVLVRHGETDVEQHPPPHRAHRHPAQRRGPPAGREPAAGARRHHGHRRRPRPDEPAAAGPGHVRAGRLRRPRRGRARPRRVGLRRRRGPAHRRDPRRGPGLDGVDPRSRRRRDRRRGGGAGRPGARADPRRRPGVVRRRSPTPTSCAS